ncbi:MAG: hypothetical protein RR980_03675 [Mucinivorans sp.]
MKKILLITFLALTTLVGFAQSNIRLSFNAMRLSEDAGKTWSQELAMKGTLLLQSKTITLTIGDDGQKYQIVNHSKTDDTQSYVCKNSDNEDLTITYNAKEKRALMTTASSMSSFSITKEAQE